MSLELLAMRFLKHEKRCVLVLNERSPREFACGRPDVLGITASRHLLEIEVKRTLSDFRANAGKRHVANREHYLESQPKQFWFLVPSSLAERVRPEVPDWAGLITEAASPGFIPLVVAKPAPTNKAARRLSLQECVKATKLAGNQLVAQVGRIEGLVNDCNFRMKIVDGPRWFL